MRAYLLNNDFIPFLCRLSFISLSFQLITILICNCKHRHHQKGISFFSHRSNFFSCTSSIFSRFPSPSKCQCWCGHAHLCLTLAIPGLSSTRLLIHGISQQARILEWGCNFLLRGSSQPRDRTCVS